jgi:hypothetical protein
VDCIVYDSSIITNNKNALRRKSSRGFDNVFDENFEGFLIAQFDWGGGESFSGSDTLSHRKVCGLSGGTLIGIGRRWLRFEGRIGREN